MATKIKKYTRGTKVTRRLRMTRKRMTRRRTRSRRGGGKPLNVYVPIIILGQEGEEDYGEILTNVIGVFEVKDDAVNKLIYKLCDEGHLKESPETIYNAYENDTSNNPINTKLLNVFQEYNNDNFENGLTGWYFKFKKLVYRGESSTVNVPVVTYIEENDDGLEVITADIIGIFEHDDDAIKALIFLLLQKQMLEIESNQRSRNLDWRVETIYNAYKNDTSNNLINTKLSNVFREYETGGFKDSWYFELNQSEIIPQEGRMPVMK